MNVLTISNVRGYVENKTPMLNLEDVARGLGFIRKANSGNEVVRWDRVEKYLEDLSYPLVGTEIKNTYIPENIFYKLCMKANNEVARRFQDLVCDEILPSIREHGIYATTPTIENMISNPDFAISLLTKLKEEREEKERLKLDNDRKDFAITKATNSLLGVEHETSRKNINSLVKALSTEYCEIHKLNPRTNISDVYMSIYRDFCKYANISFTEIQSARIKYKKSNPTVPLSSKKSYIEVFEERGLSNTLLQYLREVKIENI